MIRIAGTWRSLLRLCIAAAACAAFAGCTPAPPKPDAAKVSRFSGHAYVSDEHCGVTTALPSWTLGAASYELALTVPDKAGSYPLVIYLPGLGEARDAGSTWRTSWTQAGYAVLSVQPLAEDATGWSAPKARTGDFAALARVRYSGKTMSARIDSLQAVWGELVRRQAKGETPLERIDLSKVAIAGFDLGAYTAMTIAGEAVRDLPKLEIGIPVAAVIALSPYADFSGSTFTDRYRSIKGPVLSVTTDGDADAIGMVTAPSVRKAPFQYMPAGDKFLMLLWSVPHVVLGGSANAESVAASESARADTGSRPSPGVIADTGVRPKKKPPDSGVGDTDRAVALATTVAAATANAIGSAAIAGVTTAFLDAYMKNDVVAQEWLEKDAPRWLRDKGEFIRK
jgi:hypothetical protein